MLERHGWSALSEELHALSLQGKWQQMGTLIDDQVLDAFAVTAEPGQVAAELLRRYGDIMTRMTLYTPYATDAAVTRQIAADLQGEPVP